MKRTIRKIFLILGEAIPVLLMIILIPFTKNDYLLSGIFILIIIASLFIKYEKKDYLFLIFGFVILLIFEYLFIKTGVETFNRNSLFEIMPLWLPILWAYAFVAINRGVNILK